MPAITATNYYNTRKLANAIGRWKEWVRNERNEIVIIFKCMTVYQQFRKNQQ